MPPDILGLLQGGTISEEGTLTATGSVGNDGPGGDGITGKGAIGRARLISTCGDSVKIIDKMLMLASGSAVAGLGYRRHRKHHNTIKIANKKIRASWTNYCK